MRKILHILTVVLYSVALLFLILSYLSVIISPARSWFLSFCGLFYPFIFISNFIFLLIWIIKRKLFYIIVSVVSLGIGYNYFFDFVAYNFKEKNISFTGQKIRVLSYNVRLFDVYRWDNLKDNKKQIFDFIYNENPDIICIQEFYNNKKLFGFESTSKIVENTDAKYFYVSDIFKKGNAEFGIVTFSKYPIINKGEFRFRGKSNVSIFIDIKINSDTVRVYNLHLESNRFGKEDYIFGDDNELEIDNKNFYKIAHIYEKLKNSYIKRSYQVETIAEHIQKSPYPVIICGDFNDTPISYSYNQISNDLTDAFLKSGKGLGITYNGTFPSFRIDYIFHSKNINSSDFVIPKLQFSDHYPILCNLFLEAKNK